MSTPQQVVPEVASALRRNGVGDVDGSSLARAMYSSDASLYRVVPDVVARPRSADEVEAVVATARETGVPLTMRGAGTSIAGNAVGAGIVLDTSRHLDRVLDVDPAARTARVQPGVVQAALQARARPHGLRFGPDPSTSTRCTIGGMIGNNACGSRSLAYGRTADTVAGLDVLTAAGERMSLGPDTTSDLLGRLDDVVSSDLSLVRTRFGRFRRQVSGYSLEHLLPEHGRRADRFLVGSEGTLAVVLEATVDLVEDPPARVLLVLGHPSMTEAADTVPGLLEHPLVTCEGLDSRMVEVFTARGHARVPELPAGSAWLFVEVAGQTTGEAESLARTVAQGAGTAAYRVVTDAAEMAALWRIRADGAGLAARSLDQPAHAGWEDAAVPPQRLGAYLRDFDALMGSHGYDGIPYGHFGEGCVHVRIDFGLADPSGRARFRRFLTEAADLAAAYGGSMSGEHGDGRARSELLPRMYDDASLALFGRVKHLFDPANLLNPGVLVDPSPVDADLRLAAPSAPLGRTSLRLTHDGGSFARAAHRCTGVGKCLADNTASAGPGAAGVMCPSYLATREEKDSTRGRARVLQEMLTGEVVAQGWRSNEVHEALDLCLSCKGCASDCPTGVDMATYKAEALHQRYRGRPRPRSHYALGQLPRWARLAAPVAPAANAMMRLGSVQRLAKKAAGIDPRRSVPTFARRSLRRSAPARTSSGAVSGATGAHDVPDVWLWADTFTDHFSPRAGIAAVSVLEDAGLRVGVIGESACCALTWISTGQLSAARRILARTVRTLHPYVAAGVPVVGLEPSCLATLRSDAAELLDDPRVVEVTRGVFTLAELLRDQTQWQPPDLSGAEVVVQPHCHHASVLGWDADARLLARTGASVTRLGGCCGLAGNFGVEQGHYEVSVAVAEHDLMPAVRRAGPGALVLADGFSCRTQLDDLGGVEALHLAELLAGAR